MALLAIALQLSNWGPKETDTAFKLNELPVGSLGQLKSHGVDKILEGQSDM